MKRRASFLPVLLLPPLVLSACQTETVQPFPFNHNIHVEQSGMVCTGCHEYVEERPYAGIPRVATCILCHSIDVTQNPEAQPYVEMIRQHAAEGTDFGWRRLYELSHTVYYSHRRHVKIAGIECETCHGDMGAMIVPASAPVRRTLTMDGCMECHEQSGVENDCAWCHR